jgi:sugar lactone lactonase YvrE
VALSSDEQTLFVAETGKYRVWKVSVAANDIDLGTVCINPGEPCLS